MIAEEFLDRYGEDIIGLMIDTEPMGSWPGGPAIITSINKDEHSDIVFFVHGELDEDEPYQKCDGDRNIGIFDHELIKIINNPSPDEQVNIMEALNDT